MSSKEIIPAMKPQAPDAPGPRKPALRISRLSIAHRTRAAERPLVTDVNLDVADGEIVGLVGESGSGKSLTALACIGLLPRGVAITAGDVRLGGELLTGLSPKRMRALCGMSVSMIFQDPLSSLDPCARIGSQIVETILAHKDVSVAEARADALELLELVGIPRAAERMRAYPHEFSGGMRQRVMIAAALVLKPRVLLADEPTTALDVTTQAGIVELVRELRRELQMSVIWISHDLGVVGQLADRVAVMYAGEVVEVAATDDLFRAPRHPYTQGLIRSGNPRAYGEPFGFISGNVAEPGHWPAGCRFSPRCNRAVPGCANHPLLAPLGAGHVRCVNPIEPEAS
jgi:oligopeptide/dipeptide ABC transporter ATP-binding protein